MKNINYFMQGFLIQEIHTYNKQSKIKKTFKIGITGSTSLQDIIEFK
jgi:hypothetical protein